MLTKEDCGEPVTMQENRFILISMLKVFTKYCDDHGVRYTLSGGTLLGAIRHKGFIPWDDDIDINMPRPDINHLYDLCGGEIGRYQLIKPGDDKFTGSFFRLYDNETVMENSLGMKNDCPIYNPVFIDIFPVEGLPNSKIMRRIYYESASILRKMMRVSQRDNVAAKNKWQLFLNIISYYPVRVFGYDRLVSWFQNYIQKYDYTTSQFVGVMSASKYKTQEVIDRIGYEKVIDVDFEGDRYHAPSNYDKYLSQLYGDYMKMPPTERQKTHHTFKVYRRKSE